MQVFTDVREARKEQYDAGIKDFNSVINLYNEVLKGWLIKCVKTPIVTVLK